MFYAHLLLSKRGPLAKIWLAAHWEKKLTKAHIFECNLERAIESITLPKVTVALRTSGHLLLGVVRIYSRKAKYLLADCNEALIKMKFAFRPGIVDLPEENLEATYNAITLPEEFHDFDMHLLPDLNAIDVAEHFTLNQSRVEDITVRDDYGNENEIFRQGNILDETLLISTSNSLQPEHNSAFLAGDQGVIYDNRLLFILDGFGDEGVAGDMLDNLLSTEQDVLTEDVLGISKEIPLPPAFENNSMDNAASILPAESHTLLNETTLLLDEDEEFALQPVDITANAEKKKNKKKRKLLVDVEKELSSSTIRSQLSDFLDTISTVDIAPPTRKLMMWKETGGVENLLSNPSQCMINMKLQKLFTRCLGHCKFKTGRKGDDLESELDQSKQQELIEMTVLEEPSYLQQSKEKETSRASMDENSRKREASQANENLLRTCDQLLEISSLFYTSLTQEKEKNFTEPLDDDNLMDNMQDTEEKRWNKRIHHILKSLHHIREAGVSSISLLKFCRNNNRKQVSTKFYSFLVLKKQLAIELSQSTPYADIIATPGPRFYII
ncbi:double-strand-break repair protein rad21-like protein 1 [Microcaecilia unicolor]|uniref:Double-strand-break repair protein rad21-like protein 1 n=1 Tax=Microcaecilia unicolor TaxID=1415580 RepID=A0A6P7YWH1_9AMPH|nr:double-strand-break repair protein rad21-like protein 1 [Microcaecilia unicolor]